MEAYLRPQFLNLAMESSIPAARARTAMSAMMKSNDTVGNVARSNLRVNTENPLGAVLAYWSHALLAPTHQPQTTTSVRALVLSYRPGVSRKTDIGFMAAFICSASAPVRMPLHPQSVFGHVSWNSSQFLPCEDIRRGH
jgi:hypothetical protein